jgi:isopentenyl-diphosphate Delta-isomerase
MMNTEEQVVLVDEHDHELGLMGKTESHEQGIMHRAISILIFNSRGEMLVQQRAFTKYHWSGIWSNACCSHPRAGETFEAAAARRLYEELGFDTPLDKRFHFTYKAYDAPSGLTEHEYDWVFTGTYEGDFTFNTDEVQAIRWMSKETLLTEIKEQPELWSFWFKIILDELQRRGIY